MTLGDKIQVLRKKEGLSQEDLAEKIGVSRQAVSRWEMGQSVPEIEKLLTLSEIFKVSTDDLLKDGTLDDGQKNVSIEHKAAGSGLVRQVEEASSEQSETHLSGRTVEMPKKKKLRTYAQWLFFMSVAVNLFLYYLAKFIDVPIIQYSNGRVYYNGVHGNDYLLFLEEYKLKGTAFCLGILMLITAFYLIRESGLIQRFKIRDKERRNLTKVK